MQGLLKNLDWAGVRAQDMVLLMKKYIAAPQVTNDKTR